MNFWEYLSAFWLVVSLLCHLAVLVYILYTKTEDPADTLFWMLVVALLPMVGIVLFLFFGVNRVAHIDNLVQKVAFRLKDEREHLLGLEISGAERKLRDFAAPPETAQNYHNRMLDRLFPQSLLLDGNRLEILVDGTAAYPRMLADIENAQSSIRLQSFILMGDEVGARILEALERKAAAGVDVKVLYDDFGSFKAYFSRIFRQALRKNRPNFAIHAFSPLNLLAPWRFQMRNHRKLLVIDGRIAYSGGINISRENEQLDSVPANRRIHDLHCRITGPAVSQFLLTFFYDWAYTTRRKLGEIAVPGDFPEPAKCGDDTVRVLKSGPGQNFQGTRNLFFTAAATARQSLTIMTPYLVPGPAYIQTLCMTAARGVEVKIIVPRHNNHFFVDFAARSLYHRLLRYGVKIYEKNGRFSHIKALLVDNEWGFMGSSNCDNRSFQLNFELDFCYESGPYVEAMRQLVHDELAKSDELTLFEVERKSMIRRLAENLCALLSSIL